MTRKKLKIGIICGGKSAEHEVSCRSAKNIIAAIDKNKYRPVPVKIPKTGRGYLNHDWKKYDAVFPVLHGPYGEDGTVQGMLKLAGVPFVGCDVLGSAIGMDKEISKRLLREAGLPTARFITIYGRRVSIDFEEITRKLGLPVFVKPANAGSSVGVSKVRNTKQLKAALKKAFAYDDKVLIEEYIKGREVECSVLGNEDPLASVISEVIPKKHDFYSYEAKYQAGGAEIKIPAELPAGTARRLQEIAVRTFKTLCCAGMARVDFFLKENGEILVNEINTIPGFTSSSMYPKLWEASGLSYSKLIDKLIRLAIERHKKEQKIKTSI